MLESIVSMLFHHVKERFDLIDRQLAAINYQLEIIMPLTQAEASAFTQLGTDIGAWKADLQAKLDAAAATAAALQTSESADQATIADLTKQLSDAKAAVDNTPDVVAAINAIDQQVNPPAASAATSTGPIRTGTEPAVPGGPPAPENPAQSPDPTTVPGGTAAVTTDLNAPSQQNVPGGVDVAPAPAAPTAPAGTTSAAVQSEAPGAPSTSGGPVDAPAGVPVGSPTTPTTPTTNEPSQNLSDVPGHGSTDSPSSDASLGSTAPPQTSSTKSTF